MLFSSPIFFAFFAVFLLVYWRIPERLRLWTIIVGSTVFYAWWRVEYVFLPYALSLIGYSGALLVAKAEDPSVRRRRLIAVLAVLFLPLLVFKYTNFVLNEVFGAAFDSEIVHLGLLLPLGISFITFTICAYVVDVYRGVYPVETRLSRLLGFVLFFPHLIAGPILRPRELIPQLGALRSIVDARVTLATTIFTVGLVKKLVFADQIAHAVDSVYAGKIAVTGWDCLLAIYGFSVQIYCDFSGYTDMAIGLALVLRIKLPNNFARPYASGSVIEFWRRWHITLSHWLRDYLYIPMGGNRHGKARQLRNLVVTMVLGGLWHGAHWTFVLWGLVHGLAIAFLHLLGMSVRPPRMPNWLRVFLTFHFVTLAWILFRAPSLSSAKQVASGAFEGRWIDLDAFWQANAFVIILVMIFLAAHRFDSHAWLRLAVRKVPRAALWPVLIMFWALAITVSQASSSNFIYFDF
jgi:alginate O-acetyltransferase complex protein AlgI